MREIKFRAWTKEEMLYEGWNGDFFASKETIFRYDDIMQFTGLKDKNGKEIYEGDIVVPEDGKLFGENGYVGRVEWSEVGLGFYLKNVDWSAQLSTWEPKFLEIIGNIYENPDLLNSEPNAQASVASNVK